MKIIFLVILLISFSLIQSIKTSSIKHKKTNNHINKGKYLFLILYNIKMFRS